MSDEHTNLTDPDDEVSSQAASLASTYGHLSAESRQELLALAERLAEREGVVRHNLAPAAAPPSLRQAWKKYADPSHQTSLDDLTADA